MLVVTRVLQALGAGATSAVSTAVVKDAIAVDKREAVLSVVQVMFVIGPVLAPVVGALVLQVADWRMTFWVLALIGQRAAWCSCCCSRRRFPPRSAVQAPVRWER